MSRNNSTTITPSRERGQHLKFEDRVSIKIFKKLRYTLRKIAEAIDCSPSTVMYELRRGTGERKGSRGRFPEYNARRGQANYETNRSRCHRKAKALNGNPFIDWLVGEVRNKKGSIDSCVGKAKLLNKYPGESMVCTKTIYNAVWSGNINITPFDLPETLTRNRKKNFVRKNKRIYGTSIEERPAEISKRVEEGHWEIDTVVGKRAGKESVVLTLVEKKTDYYIAIKIPGKDSASVMTAMEVLREEYGEEYFNRIFKSITVQSFQDSQSLKIMVYPSTLPILIPHGRERRMSATIGFSGDIYPRVSRLITIPPSKFYILRMR